MIEDSESLERFESLRPVKLSHFAGQPNATRELGIVLASALARREMPDHMLLAGPPGCGKTTLAAIIANELNLPLLVTSGPAISRSADLAGLLAGVAEPTVVFIDEIHGLPRACVEMLYPVMEDGVLDIVTSNESAVEGGSQVIRLELPALVIVGATTLAGSLPGPLLQRFGHQVRVNLYDDESLSGIVARSANLMSIELGSESALTIAKRSRGTPRVANALLRRVRDYAQATSLVENASIEVGAIDKEQAVLALETFGVDSLGLDSVARSMLSSLCKAFNGGPVGLTTLAAAVGEAPVTLEQIYEPYLMRAGLIARTPRGRVATDACYTHLGLLIPAKDIKEDGMLL